MFDIRKADEFLKDLLSYKKDLIDVQELPRTKKTNVCRPDVFVKKLKEAVSPGYWTKIEVYINNIREMNRAENSYSYSIMNKPNILKAVKHIVRVDIELLKKEELFIFSDLEFKFFKLKFMDFCPDFSIEFELEINGKELIKIKKEVYMKLEKYAEFINAIMNPEGVQIDG